MQTVTRILPPHAMTLMPEYLCTPGTVIGSCPGARSGRETTMCIPTLHTPRKMPGSDKCLQVRSRVIPSLSGAEQEACCLKHKDFGHFGDHRERPLPEHLFVIVLLVLLPGSA
eukprot:1497049-Rhodomonas_salina.1